MAILDDWKSVLIGFLAISDQYATFFSAKWPRRPFWMTENHFWSHFSPFRSIHNIYTTFFSRYDPWRPFWMTENHFWSHFLDISDLCTTFIFSSASRKAATTQFSQEWARRKVVVKHSIKSKNQKPEGSGAFLMPIRPSSTFQLFDNFVSSLAWSFIRKAPMYCKNSNLAVLLLFANFIKKRFDNFI